MEVDEEMLNQPVAEYVTSEGTWDWGKLAAVLDSKCVELFIPLKAPNPDMGSDQVDWLHTSSEEFSCKTAYGACSSQQYTQNGELFRQIWKIETSQRLRAFLWLVANDALLTNLSRFRRHLTTQATCLICGNAEESVLHVLRDCQLARTTWMSIGVSWFPGGFFNLPLLDWLDFPSLVLSFGASTLDCNLFRVWAYLK